MGPHQQHGPQAGQQRQVTPEAAGQGSSQAVGGQAQGQHHPALLAQAGGPVEQRGQEDDQKGVATAVPFGKGDPEGPVEQVATEEVEPGEDEEGAELGRARDGVDHGVDPRHQAVVHPCVRREGVKMPEGVIVVLRHRGVGARIGHPPVEAVGHHVAGEAAAEPQNHAAHEQRREPGPVLDAGGMTGEGHRGDDEEQSDQHGPEFVVVPLEQGPHEAEQDDDADADGQHP